MLIIHFDCIYKDFSLIPTQCSKEICKASQTFAQYSGTKTVAVVKVKYPEQYGNISRSARGQANILCFNLISCQKYMTQAVVKQFNYRR